MKLSYQMSGLDIFRNLIIGLSKQNNQSRSKYPNISIFARSRLHNVNRVCSSVLAAALGSQIHLSSRLSARVKGWLCNEIECMLIFFLLIAAIIK